MTIDEDEEKTESIENNDESFTIFGNFCFLTNELCKSRNIALALPIRVFNEWKTEARI